jgi:hypothetical protein
LQKPPFFFVKILIHFRLRFLDMMKWLAQEFLDAAQNELAIVEAGGVLLCLHCDRFK